MPAAPSLGSQTHQLDGGGQFEPLQALDEHSRDPSGVARGSGKTERQDSRRPLPRAALVEKLEQAFADASRTRSKPATQDGDQATPGKGTRSVTQVPSPAFERTSQAPPSRPRRSGTLTSQ